MAENYSYPDTHEMFELYDVLEALLSKKNANIGLFEGAEVTADPPLDFLIRNSVYACGRSLLLLIDVGW